MSVLGACELVAHVEMNCSVVQPLHPVATLSIRRADPVAALPAKRKRLGGPIIWLPGRLSVAGSADRQRSRDRMERSRSGILHVGTKKGAAFVYLSSFIFYLLSSIHTENNGSSNE